MYLKTPAAEVDGTRLFTQTEMDVVSLNPPMPCDTMLGQSVRTGWNIT